MNIYSANTDLELITNTAEEYGIVGVHGGRVHTRNVISKACETLNSDYDEDESKYCYLSYNHPYTELGHIWDIELYCMSEAKNLVTEAFDSMQKFNK